MLSPHYKLGLVILAAAQVAVLWGFETSPLDLPTTVYFWSLSALYVTSLIYVWWPDDNPALAMWRVAFSVCAGLFCWRLLTLSLVVGCYQHSLTESLLLVAWQGWPVMALRGLLNPIACREDARSEGFWHSLWTRMGRPSMGCITPLWIGLACLPPLALYLYVELLFTHCGRYLEDPNYELWVVEKDDPAELAFFRKKTTPDFIDPTLAQLENLAELQKRSQRGTSWSHKRERRVEELDNRLAELMGGARLRQIPKRYAFEYEEDVLAAIGESTGSLQFLKKALDCKDLEEKEAAYTESIRLSRTARFRLGKARRYFSPPTYPAIKPLATEPTAPPSAHPNPRSSD